MGEDGPPGPPGITGVRVSVHGFVPAPGASGHMYHPCLFKQLDRRSSDGSCLKAFCFLHLGISQRTIYPHPSPAPSLP